MKNSIFKRISKKIDKLTLGNAYLDGDNANNYGDTEERLRQSGYSHRYHNYYEGYYERQITDRSGKIRIERLYCGPTYRQEVSDTEWILYKLLFAAMYLTASFFFIKASSYRYPGGAAWYVQAASAMGAATLLVMLYYMILRVASARSLTVYNYKTTSRMILSLSLVSACTSFLLVPTTIIYSLVSGETAGLAGRLLTILVCPALMACMAYLEARKIRYTRTPYEKDIPLDAVSM